MKNTVQLSIVIPAYNEENRLPHTLAEVIAYVKEQTFASEIIVVSDGSCDKTVQVAKSFQASYPAIRVLHNVRNRGKGASIRRGVAAARGQKILFTDADLSTPIREFENMDQALERGADVVIASRAVSGAQITGHQPFYRELMGKTFNRFVQMLVLPGLHDTQCGFKLFRRTLARKIFMRLTIPGFGFDAEMLYLARKGKGRIVEVPVSWHNVLDSKVSPIRHSSQMLLDLFRIRWRHRKMVL